MTVTTYRPSANAANASTLADAGTQMTIDGQFVSAEVTETGQYTVFIGLTIVATGQLDGTEGSLNVFFAAEALIAASGAGETPCAVESCTCEHADRTETVHLRGCAPLRVCKTAAIGHYTAMLNRQDSHTAWVQNGHARMMTRMALRKLQALGA